VLHQEMPFYWLFIVLSWGCLWQEEAVQQVVDLLEEYSLDQEDMDTIVGMSTLKVWFELYELCRLALTLQT